MNFEYILSVGSMFRIGKSTQIEGRLVVATKTGKSREWKRVLMDMEFLFSSLFLFF